MKAEKITIKQPGPGLNRWLTDLNELQNFTSKILAALFFI